MIEIVTAPGGDATRVSALTAATSARMTFTLLNEADPGASPVDIATIHLSPNTGASVGAFLVAGARRISLTGDPSTLWVFPHSESDFVQIVIES